MIKNLWGWNLLRCKKRGKRYRNFSWHFKSCISDQLTLGTKGMYIVRGTQLFCCRLIWVIPPTHLPSAGDRQALPATQREKRGRESKDSEPH